MDKLIFVVSGGGTAALEQPTGVNQRELGQVRGISGKLLTQMVLQNKGDASSSHCLKTLFVVLFVHVCALTDCLC